MCDFANDAKCLSHEKAARGQSIDLVREQRHDEINGYKLLSTL